MDVAVELSLEVHLHEIADLPREPVALDDRHPFVLGSVQEREDACAALRLCEVRHAGDDVEMQVLVAFLLGEQHDVGLGAPDDLAERRGRGCEQRPNLCGFGCGEFVQRSNVPQREEHEPAGERAPGVRQTPVLGDERPVPVGQRGKVLVPLTRMTPRQQRDGSSALALPPVEFEAIRERALSVRRRYEERERERYGRPWSLEELTLGFVGDVGDLAKLVQAHEGVREIDNVEERLAHELADALWSLIVIADRCGIDLEASFVRTMNELDNTLGGPR